MSIDKLQEKIRKMKNPSMVDFSVELDKIPPHILEEENNEILGYERFCRELMDGLRNLVPAVRFNMGRFSILGSDGLFLLSRLTAYAKELDYYVLLDGYDYPNANAKNCSFAFDKLGHGAIACAGSSITAAWVTDKTEGIEFVACAVEAAERMKKNLLRYVTVL